MTPLTNSLFEEGPLEEIDEQLQIAVKTDERSAEQSDKNQQSGSTESNNGAKKPTSDYYPDKSGFCSSAGCLWQNRAGSVDIKLQRVQSNLVKGLVPIVSVIEKLEGTG